jgi:preprotein translocase subunit YajC
MKTKIFPDLRPGDRVRLSGGQMGTVQKSTVTRRGHGSTLFVEVLADSGVIFHPRRSCVTVVL